jgi:vacuolar iron transporter family protein
MDLHLQEHLETHHGHDSAKYIKNIIYGGIDGIITTFSIIAASYGAGFEIKYIITMGVANLIADGFSMGMGDYISSFFENQYILSEKKKEEEEYINNNLYEIGEMNELYVKEGFDQEDADSLVTMLISKEKYKPIFIKNMVLMELGLIIPEDNYKQVIKKEAFITFLSFIGFGFVPILFYIIFYYSDYDSYKNIFIINCFITSCTMFGLGVYQAKITKQNIYKGGIVLTINGVIAASLAFIIGYGINLIL